MIDKTQAGAFVRVTGLYRRTSRSGRALYFGRLADGRRLYLFPNKDRRPKDCAPSYWLCVRAEDQEPSAFSSLRVASGSTQAGDDR